MRERTRQNILEALDRMRNKPRSQSSVQQIDKLIERVNNMKGTK